MFSFAGCCAPCHQSDVPGKGAVSMAEVDYRREPPPLDAFPASKPILKHASSSMPTTPATSSPAKSTPVEHAAPAAPAARQPEPEPKTAQEDSAPKSMISEMLSAVASTLHMPAGPPLPPVTPTNTLVPAGEQPAKVPSIDAGVAKEADKGPMAQRYDRIMAGREAKYTGTRRPSTMHTTLDAYTAKHDDKFKALRDLEGSSDWHLKTRQDEVDVYTCHQAGKPVTCFKGVTLIGCRGQGLGHLLSCLVEAENRPKWDDMCMGAKVLESAPPFYRVSTVRLRSPAIVISNRDVVLSGRLKVEEDGTILIALESTTHPGAPEDSAFVRLNFIAGGYVIRPTEDPDVFKVSFCGCVDPMGWIPQWIKDAVAWKQALTLGKFRSFLLKSK